MFDRSRRNLLSRRRTPALQRMPGLLTKIHLSIAARAVASVSVHAKHRLLSKAMAGSLLSTLHAVNVLSVPVVPKRVLKCCSALLRSSLGI